MQLPSYGQSHSRHSNSRSSSPLATTRTPRRRHAKLGLLFVCGGALLYCLFAGKARITGIPDYADFRAFEAALPQHNLELPFPEGRTG